MSVTHAAERAVATALKHSKGLTSADKGLLAGLSGADLDRATAQLMLQKQQETVFFISKLIKSDSTIQVLNNLR
jgi:hypothetical protein